MSIWNDRDRRRGDKNVADWSKAMLAALDRSQAVIEFAMDGTILSANENFCRTLGYTPEELRGQHHSMFVDPAMRQSPDYRAFWDKLRRGEYDAGEYKRIGKGGKEVWIQASYNPIMGADGKPIKVVKFAADITDQVTTARLNAGMLAALDRSQATIEFALDGTILTANDNFCQTLGYTLGEIRGKHHSMFVDHAFRQSPEYRMFWDALGRGEYQSAKYPRVGKGGREIWIQASYNPIMDGNGKPFKVVKFAADVTQIENERKAAEAERAAHAAEQARVVSTVGSGLKQMAEGNLTVRLNTAFAAEYEDLRTDFNDAMSKMQSAMSLIANSAAGIQSGASEISQAADDLSRRTEQQAASLEETAAALDQITATVKKSAQGANEANAVVATARKDGEASGDVVRRAVAAMGEIERSAKQINQIIGVIDEIAFQTNLLALNAGVEAARAGDAGRGFAVVASEVRALAQRSAEAAKQIKGLISESSQQVESGVDLVGEAGDSLVRILEQIGRISQLVSEISSSSQEQATGLSQVNTAVNQMDQVTQQNAAMVEESTAASKSLAKESSDLAALVSEFNIGERVATRERRPHAVSSAGSTSKVGHARGAVVQARTTSQRKALPSPTEADWQEF